MTDRKTDKQPNEITDEALDQASGGVDAKRDIDYVGNYNFKVEISGVNAGYVKGVDGLQTEIKSTDKG